MGPAAGGGVVVVSPGVDGAAAALLVALGAAAGAVLRHLAQRFFEVRAEGRGGSAWGTASVNVLGSFLLGVVVGARSAETVVLLLGTGLCGAFTTFSAFAHETLQTAASGRARLALARIMLEVTAGLAACCAGWALGAALA